MSIRPLEVWHPRLFSRWESEGRRLYVPLSAREGYTIHHSAGGDSRAEADYAREVGDWHFSKWSRPGGYNFLIGNMGTIFEMCGWNYVGAHAPGCNYSTIGVCFQGTFTNRLPNKFQMDSFSKLVGSHAVPNNQGGHRDCSSTSCPGNALYSHIPLDVSHREDDDLTPEQDKMLREVHAALDAGKSTTAITRIRHSLRALGSKAGIKVNPSSGKPGEDITA